MASTSTTRTQPKLFFEIFDHIFAFLHPKSLIACSEAHPFFSTIAERHLYHHIILARSSRFYIVGSGPGYFLMPSHLIRLLSEAPQIVNHVRVLQIELCRPETHEELALILPMLTALESIALTSRHPLLWNLMVSQTLVIALAECLRLPTLRVVHVDDLYFPLSMLDANDNMKELSFSRSSSFSMADRPDDNNPPFQLTSLKIKNIDPGYRTFFTTWAKQHITKLQSLKCCYLYDWDELIFEFLKVCSDTLIDLDIELRLPYGNAASPMPLNLSSLPHLEKFTIRKHIDLLCVRSLDNMSLLEDVRYYQYHFRWVVETLKTTSSLEHVTIEVRYRDDHWKWYDFSPLAALAGCSSAFRHIEVYIPNATLVSCEILKNSSLEKLMEVVPLVVRGKETDPVPFPYPPEFNSPDYF